MAVVANLTARGGAASPHPSIDVRAVVLEVSAQAARDGHAALMSLALSQMQANGYHAFRLAHHLHTIGDLEPWYSLCIGVRAFKLLLHIKPLSAAGWAELLSVNRDLALGRADTLSLVLSREAVGRGAEGRWSSASMNTTLPAEWRRATCGG